MSHPSEAASQKSWLSLVCLCVFSALVIGAPAPRGPVHRKDKSGPSPASLGPTAFAGRVRAIAVRPDNPDNIWVASASGGLWNTRDGGLTWRQADDFLPTLVFSTIVMDPQNPDVMYAGSGEIFTFRPEGSWPRGEDRGGGIFKSVNAGASWSLLASTDTADFRFVSRIAVHPTSGIVLAATDTGLFRSEDGGSTFSKLALPQILTLTNHMLDVKFHPLAPNNAVASGHGGGIFVSTDAGALTWQRATLPSGIAASPNSETRIEVLPRPSQANGWFALQIDDRSDPAAMRLLESADAGQSFQLSPSFSNPLQCDGDTMGNNLLYSGGLWADSASASNLAVIGTFVCLRIGPGAQFTSFQAPGVDNHAMVQRPGTDTVYVGNDDGFHRIDHVRTAPANTDLDKGLVNQQFYGAAMNPLSGVIIGGLQDRGTMRRDTDGTWHQILGGDGGHVVTDPADQNYWYYIKSQGRVVRSHDGGLHGECITGQSAQPLLDAHPGSEIGCNAAADDTKFSGQCFSPTPMLLDAADARVLFVGCEHLWRTADAKASTPGQVNWKPILSLDTGYFVTAVAAAAARPAALWVGASRGSVVQPAGPGEIWVTSDAVTATPAWTQVDTTGLPARPIAGIAVHPASGSRAWVAFAGWAPDGSHNLWRRDLDLATRSFVWRDVSAGLPPGPIYSVTTHPQNPGWVYAGTNEGLYVSHDDGNTWSATTRGPARVHIADLTWAGNTLVIGTYGRGVFTLDQSPDPESVHPEALTYLAGRTTGGHLENLLDDPDSPDGFPLVSGAARGSSAISYELSGRSGLPAQENFVFFDVVSSAAPNFGGPAPQLTIGLFDFGAATFIDVLTVNETTTLTRHEGGIVVLPGSEFISGAGEVRARLTWSGATSARLDTAEWRIFRN